MVLSSHQMSDYGNNWPVENPELNKIVEQLLKDHTYDECVKISERLLYRVNWLREYWAKEDY